MSKFVPAAAAKVVIIFHVITYYMLVWGTNHLFGFTVDIHFIHIYAILFFIEVFMMLVIGMVKPREEAYIYKTEASVDMLPWKYTIATSVILLSLVCATYIVFSPIGLAYADGYVSAAFWPAIAGLVLITGVLVFASIKHWNRKYEEYLLKQHTKKNYRLRRPSGKLNPVYIRYMTN